MITAKLILPFGQYHLDETLEWDQENDCWEDYPTLTAIFFSEDEDGLVEDSRYSNITAFIRDLEAIVERDGWEGVHESVKGVIMRHPVLELIMRGEIPASIKFPASEV